MPSHVPPPSDPQPPARFAGDPSATWEYWVEVDPEVIPDEWVWERLRAVRDRVLAASDWTQVVDANADRAAWAAYRQSLRDLPGSAPDPRTIAWPVAPTDSPSAVTAADANERTIKGQAQGALQNNRAYLAIATPTAAQMRDQLAALTRQNNGVLRLLLGKLDATD